MSASKSHPFIHPEQPAVVLAPMEGVTDAPMREMLSERGGFSYCVSEFIRVNQHPLPAKVVRSEVPEALRGCRTPSGVPVQVQLLGGDAAQIAISAQNAVMAGAQGIDLNFGCPAPTVNRHDGGATLLKYPERIREIVRSVREALPPVIPVSAKLRLGWDDMNAIHLNARMAEEGGASWITIHGRTKLQGYIPPAYWKIIGEVKRALSIPVVANGEIWTLDDFRRCREETGAIHFMIGRGALADPSLPLQMSRELGLPIVRHGMWKNRDWTNEDFRKDSREDWIRALVRYSEICGPDSQGTRYTAARMKQWLRYAFQKHQTPWFDLIRKTQTEAELFDLLSTGSIPQRLLGLTSEGAHASAELGPESTAV